MLTTELVISLILGLVLVFFGYKLKRVAFAIAWFVIGLNLALVILPQLQPYLGTAFDQVWYDTIFPFMIGLLLALVGLSIEKLCIALLCFAGVCLVAFQQFGFVFPIYYIAPAVGVILGCIATAIMKPATIAITALIGASTLANLITNTFPGSLAFYLPILAIITVVGYLFQTKNCRNIE